MTTETQHTYSFYLMAQNRVHRDIRNNRTAHRHVNQNKNTNIALLGLMNKYNSDKHISGNISRTITHSQATSERLDSEFNALQSEAGRLNTYLSNNEDIAGRAYEIAYATPQQTNIVPQSIIQRALKFLARHTK